ncbi:two component transcriptional regulator, LuxR family [Nitrosomonas marina]|uniref:Two component transcriptional regulator, LuxR family n=1 Tax=Nitrosomonas marina TaxID=917 RepID=A0A1H9YA56_9PROT|nr:response regulator [Nitrosomonas marina]SES65274.1 two component transcriptional regulator, LuxR family [Nitrosomonas marina]
MTDTYTAFIIDDDAAVRHSLMLMVEQEGIPVRVFDSAEAFLDEYSLYDKGCIIVDIHMPGMDGLRLQEILRNHQCTLPIIFLTGFGTIPQSVKAMKAGALDFLTKPIARTKLVASIRSAFSECEKQMRASKHNHKAKSFLSKLTEREKEVVALVVQGLPNKEIAALLDISHRTVEIHRKNIMRKSGVANLLELVQLVNESGADELLSFKRISKH